MVPNWSSNIVFWWEMDVRNPTPPPHIVSHFHSCCPSLPPSAYYMGRRRRTIPPFPPSPLPLSSDAFEREKGEGEEEGFSLLLPQFLENHWWGKQGGSQGYFRVYAESFGLFRGLWCLFCGKEREKSCPWRGEDPNVFPLSLRCPKSEITF